MLERFGIILCLHSALVWAQLLWVQKYLWFWYWDIPVNFSLFWLFHHCFCLRNKVKNSGNWAIISVPMHSSCLHVVGHCLRSQWTRAVWHRILCIGKYKAYVSTHLANHFNSTPSDPVWRTWWKRYNWSLLSWCQRINRRQPTLLIATGKDRVEGYRIIQQNLAELARQI